MLICTKNTPFSFLDWQFRHLTGVYAGCECVMALTAEGEVLQKVTEESIAARTEYWTGIRDISVSPTVPGLAMGLAADGTCLLSKRALRRLCEGRLWDFTRVNDAVKQWTHLTQVLVTDAFFALDRDGRVHCVHPDPLCGEYRETELWEKVVRLAAGDQNSVFGITEDGRVLCAGSNCLRGPNGDVRKRLAALSGVTDLKTAGSECERILLSRRDGTVTDLVSGPVLTGACTEAPVFAGNFALTALQRADGTLSFLPYFFPQEALLRRLEQRPVSAFAVGSAAGESFVLALKR